MVVESGVQSSLHQNSRHQIVFARFSLKVVFPPPYKRKVWHFRKANVDHIRKAINGFQWEKSFQEMNVNDMVHLFNRTIKNILHNFILHEVITCDGRDPPWIKSSIKRLIQDKNEAYKRFIKEVITIISTLKIFNQFRIYKGFPLKRLSRDIILVYPQFSKNFRQS